MSKKVKVKKIKKEKLPFKERLGGLFFTMIALILAVVVFAGFLFLQSYYFQHNYISSANMNSPLLYS